jgi:hypothetical protein
MWNAFQDVAPPPQPPINSIEDDRGYLITELRVIGDHIGGHVKMNIDLGIKDIEAFRGRSIYPPHPIGFTNGCATRLSYVLNRAGAIIAQGAGWRTVSGADHYNYIYTVREMKLFLLAAFGQPDLQMGPGAQPANFGGRQGIIIFDVAFSDATGHATLWDGARAVDHDYFYPGRGLTCAGVHLWECP